MYEIIIFSITFIIMITINILYHLNLKNNLKYYTEKVIGVVSNIKKTYNGTYLLLISYNYKDKKYKIRYRINNKLISLIKENHIELWFSTKKKNKFILLKDGLLKKSFMSINFFIFLLYIIMLTTLLF